MRFIDTSYFFEVDENGEEKRFRLFALEEGGKRKEEANPDDLFDGVQIASNDAALVGETVKLGGSANQSEFRTVNLKHTYEKQGVFVTIKSPVAQRRTFKKTLFASYVIAPENGDPVRGAIRAALQSVLKGSVLVAAVASPSTAFPAFSEMVHAQLSQKNIEITGPLRLGLYTTKEYDGWQTLTAPTTAEEEKAAAGS